jgi:hypothetical protein
VNGCCTTSVPAIREDATQRTAVYVAATVYTRRRLARLAVDDTVVWPARSVGCHVKPPGSLCAPWCRCQARYHCAIHCTAGHFTAFDIPSRVSRDSSTTVDCSAPRHQRCSPAPAMGFFRLLRPAFVCASARADALRLRPHNPHNPHNTLAWLARRRGAGRRAAAFATSRPSTESTSQPAGADSPPPANHRARPLSDHRAIPSASPMPQGGGPLAASQLTFRAIERPFTTRRSEYRRCAPLSANVSACCQIAAIRSPIVPAQNVPRAGSQLPSQQLGQAGRHTTTLRPSACQSRRWTPRLADAPRSRHWHKRNTHFRPVQTQSRSRLCLAERGTWIAYHSCWTLTFAVEPY